MRYSVLARPRMIKAKKIFVSTKSKRALACLWSAKNGNAPRSRCQSDIRFSRHLSFRTRGKHWHTHCDEFLAHTRTPYHGVVLFVCIRVIETVKSFPVPPSVWVQYLVGVRSHVTDATNGFLSAISELLEGSSLFFGQQHYRSLTTTFNYINQSQTWRKYGLIY